MRWIILASLSIASGPALATNCEHEADRSFQVDAAGLRTLATQFGSTDLRLRGVPGLAKVEVRARACASDADDLDRLTLNHRVDGDRLVVESERHRSSFSFTIFGSHYAYLDIEIRMPASLAVEVDSGSGDIDARDLASLEFDAGSGDLNVQNVAGELIVSVGSGDVEGSDIGRLHLKSTGSGDIALDDIRGDVEVGGVGSGDLTFSKVAGSVRIDHVGSGDVGLRDVTGDVTIGSIGSGDVDATDIRGNLSVKSSGSGEVSHRNIGGRVDVPGSD
jgi:DUF4097 and DUF4098 domain-containing protein YvlB